MKSLKGLSKRFELLLVIFFLFISTGCAKKEAIKNSAEEVLRERVMAYWNYKINGEFDKSYEFEDPFYRETVSMVSYIKSFSGAVKWRGLEITGMKIDGEVADIGLNLRLDVAIPQFNAGTINSAITEKWVNVEGKWHHIQPKKGLSRK